jgi:hypothetical protein
MTAAPLSLSARLSIVGVLCRVLLMTMFAFFESMVMRISLGLLGLGTMTISDTQLHTFKFTDAPREEGWIHALHCVGEIVRLG